MKGPNAGQEEMVYAFGPFVANPVACTLHRDGAPVVLSLRSFEVLMVLIKHQGRVVNKDTLLTQVWDGRIVDENNLARHISTLRKVLNEDPHNHQYIITVPGRGYRFAAPVRELPWQEHTEYRPPVAEPTLHASESANAPLVSEPDSRATFRPVTAILSACALLTVLIGSTYLHKPSVAPLPERTLWQLTSSGALETDAAWDRNGQFIAYSSDRSGNLDIWVQSVHDDRVVQLTSSPAHDWQPSWSPDGQVVVFRSERDGGGLFVVPATGGLERRLTNFGYRPQFSPRQPAVLFSSTNVTRPNLYLVDVEGQHVRRVLADFLDEFLSARASWHPDGDRVSIFGLHRKEGRSFWTVPLDGGPAVRSTLSREVAGRLETIGVAVTDFAWSPSGDALYLEGRRDEATNIFRVQVNPATLEWQTGPERLTFGPGRTTGIAISPDGHKLVFTARDEKTRLWSFPFDPNQGRILGRGEPISTEGSEAVSPDMSASGTDVVYRTVRRGKHELRRRSLTNGEDTVVLATSNAGTPRWSDDGSLVAFRRLRPPQPGSNVREGAIVLVSADGRDERLLTEPGPDEFTPFDWSSDGKWIVGTCEQGPAGRRNVCLLPVSSAPRAQKQMRIIAADPERNLYQATFSPDQQWITFVATSWGKGVSTVYVVGPNGGQWTAISEGTFWDDKPRWSPDGKTIYFLSNRSGFVNVWGRRFDPATGKPAGDAFQVTSIDAPGTRVLSPTFSTELAIAPDRLILPIVESSGSVWVLENIGR